MSEIGKNGKGRMVIYACGGFGANAMSQLKNVATNPNTTADIEVIVIDTSESNLKNLDPSTPRYLLEDKDGSGKKRSTNSEAIAERIKHILNQHQPGDINIVVHSGGGGSGSVFGPLIVGELLSRKIPVIPIVVGSVGSKIEVQNTLNTLKTYDAQVRRTQAPVVMSYWQNSEVMSRAEVDARVIGAITSLSVLFSRLNHGLDSADLANFLRFNEVTSHPAQVTSMAMVWTTPPQVDKEKPDNEPSLSVILSKVGTIMAAATLAPVGASTTLPLTLEYHTDGFLPEGEPTTNVGVDPLKGKRLDYIIADGQIKEVKKGLVDLLAKLEEEAASRPPALSLLDDGDEVGSNGLVL